MGSHLDSKSYHMGLSKGLLEARAHSNHGLHVSEGAAIGAAPCLYQSPAIGEHRPLALRRGSSKELCPMYQIILEGHQAPLYLKVLR